MTRTIEIKNGTSRVFFSRGPKDWATFIEGQRSFVITDRTVDRLYGDSFPSCHKKIVIGTGEASKTLPTVKHIYSELLSGGADRSSLILGIGGGVVCDVTGFAASTFMRGVPFGLAPTTLLAQVDAAIGGKNGVNFKGYKNMVGSFNQPAFVVIDPFFLRTLSPRAISCGFAEIVKSAAIADPEFFQFLEQNHQQALGLEGPAITRIIPATVKIKMAIVARDEKEKGERKKLNFGHSFAHAFEKAYRVSHGEAVSLGMILAAGLSVNKGILSRVDFERLRAILMRFRLPVFLRFQKKPIFDALEKDKKKKGETIDFVLLKSIGEAVIENTTFQELQEVMHDLCELGN